MSLRRVQGPPRRRVRLLLATGVLAACVQLAFAHRAAATAVAQDSPARQDSGATAAASGGAVIESRDLGHGLLFVRSCFDLPWPPRRVRDVVADYDHIADYASAVDSSAVVRRDSTAVLVRQVGRTHFLLDRRVHLVLRFHEQPPELLRFEIVSGDFPVYYGSWRFEPRGTGTRLTYSVTLEPPAWVPQALVKHILERDLRLLLPEIAYEVERRGITSPAPDAAASAGSRP